MNYVVKITSNINNHDYGVKIRNRFLEYLREHTIGDTIVGKEEVFNLTQFHNSSGSYTVPMHKGSREFYTCFMNDNDIKFITQDAMILLLKCADEIVQQDYESIILFEYTVNGEVFVINHKKKDNFNETDLFNS